LASTLGSPETLHALRSWSAKEMQRRLAAHRLTAKNKWLRAIWQIAWLVLYRPSPKLLHSWRAFLLRLFGARIGTPTYIYPSSRVWAPWNLTMADHSTLAEGVDCYCVDKVSIGKYSTISQYSFLCTATHDYLDPAIMTQPQMELLIAPITIEDRVWVTSDVFVGPGVTLHEGAVILARSTVLRDIPAWTVAAGYPAVPVKKRILRDSGNAGSASHGRAGPGPE
jgi:putative colanic acid biosynthesis acetyltransferase WcaF